MHNSDLLLSDTQMNPEVISEELSARVNVCLWLSVFVTVLLHEIHRFRVHICTERMHTMEVCECETV